MISVKGWGEGQSAGAEKRKEKESKIKTAIDP